MEIIAENLSKKFQRDWIFRNLNLRFQSPHSYTVVGPNGSGKSTLLQILAGVAAPTNGEVTFKQQQQTISVEHIYRHLSIAAPYLELIEEFTLLELVKFHSRFKPLKNDLSLDEFMDIMKLGKARHKMIKHFSSGMKQRLKLGLAFYTGTEIILLDEPTSNLDNQGIDWYHQEIEKNTQDRLLILCSNQAYEYEFCDEVIDITSFK
ncbi:ABC transporter ATP-binding protein [uncultured Microscilla sp.]|uniref:ABC transporter ATP-binding protein n=1 Tax=uncultured Microscilla sp. TaxID=432653 RepID=UPI00260BDA4E|nr:ABC transporter ATP-binding protein [uncultured Microscilla sp.]